MSSDKIWLKQRELEIAVWEDTLEDPKLKDDDRKMYLNAIEENRNKIEKYKETGEI